MFLYFVPKSGEQFAIPESIGYAFNSKTAGGKLHRRETSRGPNGAGPGFIIADAASMANADRIVLQDAAQRWVHVHDPKTPDKNLRPQVGVWNDDKLTPSTLQRPVLIEGHPVELGDGSQWQAAIARAYDVSGPTVEWFTPLPKTLAFDSEKGRWDQTQVAKQYRRFFDLALAYIAIHDAAIANDEPYFEFPEVDELAIGALTTNYRIGQAELGLFDDVYTVAVRDALLAAVLDFPTMSLWTQKKSESGLDGLDT